MTKIFLVSAMVLCGALPVGAQSFVVGGAGEVGGVHSPYASTCAGDNAGVGGLRAHAGIQNGGWSGTVTYERLAEMAAPICVATLPLPPDGTYTFRTYDGHGGDGLSAASVRVGYSPAFARFAAIGAGVGIETGERDPLLVASLSLHTGGRLRLAGGGQIAWLRASYQDHMQQWQNRRLISDTQLDNGHSWRSATGFWLGVEAVVAPGAKK